MGRLTDQFSIASGTIIGREHVRCHRNNQDGLAVSVADDLIVAAVTDGCSSGRYSEVGARLGAAWLVRWVPVYLQRHRSLSSEAFLHALGDGFVAYLGSVARRLSPDRDALPAIVQDFLLFTFQVAVVAPEQTGIIGLGDGLVGLNDARVTLEAGPDNAPTYLAYRLVENRLLAPMGPLVPVVHHHLPTVDSECLLIATDGLADLDRRADVRLATGEPAGSVRELAADPRFVRNPALLQKRLIVLGELNHLLPDDTTVVLIQRREVTSCA